MNPIRLSAFTLIELLVALSLTSLALALGLFLYRSTIQWHLQYQQGVDRSFQQAMFQAYLQGDMRSCDRITGSAAQWVLFDQEGDSVARYQSFEGGFLRQRAGRRDSFYLTLRVEVQAAQASILLADEDFGWQRTYSTLPHSQAQDLSIVPPQATRP